LGEKWGIICCKGVIEIFYFNWGKIGGCFVARSYRNILLQMSYENIVGGRLRRPRGPKAPSDVRRDTGFVPIIFLWEYNWGIICCKGVMKILYFNWGEIGGCFVARSYENILLQGGYRNNIGGRLRRPRGPSAPL